MKNMQQFVISVVLFLLCDSGAEVNRDVSILVVSFHQLFETKIEAACSSDEENGFVKSDVLMRTLEGHSW